MAKKKSTFVADFKAFITRGNVVDMAVGVAVASAFTAIVTAFTKGFIAPILALLSNDASLAEFKWVIRPEVTDAEGIVTTPEVAILWGAFLQAIIDFLLIAFVMFCILRIFMATSNKLADMRKEVADKVNQKELEEKAEAEAKAAEEAAKAEAAAAEAAAAEAAKAEVEAAEKAKQAAEDRAALLRQTELLEKICALLEKK